MRAMIVLGRPAGGSFDHAVAAAATAGFATARGSPERADLHAAGFGPRRSLADVSATRGAFAPPADVRRDQQCNGRAVTLVLAHLTS
jgi:NAD(P)H dehydrogenase (quinone)